MRSNVPTKWLVGGAAMLLACSEPPTNNRSSADLTMPASASSSTTRPVGTVIGTVASPSPWGLAVRGNGLVYFTNLYDGNVGITNTSTRTVTGNVATGYLPTGVAFSPNGTRAYSANQGDNTVTVIDVGSSAPIASISTGGSSPFSVIVSPDGTQLYVGDNDNTITVVDTRTLQITKVLTVGAATNAFAILPGGRKLYASAFVGGTVSEIDMSTNTITRTFYLGGTPQGMAINRRGTHLYVANEAGYINDVDLTTGQLGAQIPLNGGGFGVGVDADGEKAWITIPSLGQVQVFDMDERKVTGSLAIGGNPRRIGFSDRGGVGAISNLNGYVTFVK